MREPLAAPTARATPPVREVPLSAPFSWLRLGWSDFTHLLLPSALHGLLLAVGGAAIFLVAWGRYYVIAGAFSGFLLVSPVLVTGLYELSRLHARGQPAGLREVIAAWRRGTRPLVGFGLLLMFVGTCWVAISVGLIKAYVREPIPDFESFVRLVVLSQDVPLFLMWVGSGGVLAAFTFAITVVSAPLMLDRQVDLLTALRTSVRAVSANPLVMALWATIIMVASFLGMATMLIGLVLAIPIIGHASWHAYVATVDASALPPRAH